MKKLENERRLEAMKILTEWLGVLRVSLNVTQEQVSCKVGISRQTYSSLELNKKEMTWNVFLALFFFFMSNEKSKNLLEKKNGYIQGVLELLTVS